MKPTDGTLGTDDGILVGFWIEYTKKTAALRIPIDLKASVLAAGTPMAARLRTTPARALPV